MAPLTQGEESNMTTPTITGFRMDTPDDRTLHFSADPDLAVKLNRGGVQVGNNFGTSLVLISLDTDGERSDAVDVDAPSAPSNVDVIDRAIATLQLVRDALGRTA